MTAKRNPNEKDKDDSLLEHTLPLSMAGVPEGILMAEESTENRQRLLEQLDVEIEMGLEQIRQGKLISSEAARERLFPSKCGDES